MTVISISVYSRSWTLKNYDNSNELIVEHKNVESNIDPSNMTTLIIMAYTNNNALMTLLSKYNDFTLFGSIIWEIIIVWNNPSLSFNRNHTSLHIDNKTHIIPIHVYQQSKNSMANRWFISTYHNFKTQSAIFIDDDMFINEYSISCMLQTFLRHPYRIIAPSHTNVWTTRQLQKTINNEQGKIEWEYMNTHGEIFNMLLPGMSMFNTDYLPKLSTCINEYELLDIIDHQIAHCDDIAMILSMSMINEGNKYLLGIHNILIEDYSSLREQTSLTDKRNLKLRYEQRSQCLTMIMQKFIEHNKKIHSFMINPIIDHDMTHDTIDCDKCEWCDDRGCWYTRKQLNKLERMRLARQHSRKKTLLV